MKTDNNERLENVIAAYAVHLKNSDKARIFEIGEGYDGISRVSEVSRHTGEGYASYSAHNCGCIDESHIDEIEQYLVSSLLDRQLIKSRILIKFRIRDLNSTLHIK